MARTAHIDPPTRVLTTIPRSIHTALCISMFSALEGRVPHGAWNKLITRWASEELCKPEQDRQLAEILRTSPNEFTTLETLFDFLLLSGYTKSGCAIAERFPQLSSSSRPLGPSQFSPSAPSSQATSTTVPQYQMPSDASPSTSPNSTDTTS